MYGADYLYWCEAEEARTELRLHRQAVLAGLSEEARALVEADEWTPERVENLLLAQHLMRQQPATNISPLQQQFQQAMAYDRRPLFGSVFGLVGL